MMLRLPVNELNKMRAIVAVKSDAKPIARLKANIAAVTAPRRQGIASSKQGSEFSTHSRNPPVC